MLVTRFAPSPTGYLHIGHAYSASIAKRAARGGRFLLRIEDIDPVRCRPEFTEAVFEDLAWLGLTWEQPVRKQSEHLEDYRKALDRLRDMGVLYPCFCSRREIAEEVAAAGHAPHGPDGVIYPGSCRALPPTEQAGKLALNGAANWRLDVRKALAITGALRWRDRALGEVEARPQDFGDVVLARKDVPASYHLSVTVDDALQGITLVTRGDDLVGATGIHRLLQALLGLPVPEYWHHPLLKDASGRRFAKRDKAETLRAMRERGVLPGDVRRMADPALARRTTTVR
jgi:glutamyl-Q tRNA(Asp) synthetase